MARTKRNPGLNTNDEGMTLMRMNLKHFVWGSGGRSGYWYQRATALAVGAPFFQDHDQDYSKNKTYQQGVREGHDDQAHKRDHSKKRHFKKDDDQKAYEAGYQKGRGN